VLNTSAEPASRLDSVTIPAYLDNGELVKDSQGSTCGMKRSVYLLSGTPVDFKVPHGLHALLQAAHFAKVWQLGLTSNRAS
jgi:hypothetical protein